MEPTTAGLLVDVVIVLPALLFAVKGDREGFIASATTFFGFLGGAILGTQLAPFAADFYTEALAKLIALLLVVFALALGGMAIATAIGLQAPQAPGRGGLRRLDHLAGPLVAFVAVLLVTWVAAAPLWGTLDARLSPPPFRNSSLLTGIDEHSRGQGRLRVDARIAQHLRDAGRVLRSRPDRGPRRRPARPRARRLQAWSSTPRTRSSRSTARPPRATARSRAPASSTPTASWPRTRTSSPAPSRCRSNPTATCTTPRSSCSSLRRTSRSSASPTSTPRRSRSSPTTAGLRRRRDRPRLPRRRPVHGDRRPHPRGAHRHRPRHLRRRHGHPRGLPALRADHRRQFRRSPAQRARRGDRSHLRRRHRRPGDRIRAHHGRVRACPGRGAHRFGPRRHRILYVICGFLWDYAIA